VPGLSVQPARLDRRDRFLPGMWNGSGCGAAGHTSVDSAWYSAPGYNRLAYPFIIAVVGAVLAIFIGASFESGYVVGWLASIVLLAALAVTIWITREDGFEACIHCLFLIPSVIVGYLGSIFVFIGGVIGVIGYIVSLHVPGIFISGMIAVVAAGGVWVSRKVDRYIAGRCIARYLASRSVD